jgi:hypothetical protein
MSFGEAVGCFKAPRKRSARPSVASSFRKPGESDAASAFESPNGRDPYAAPLGQIGLAPRQSHPIRTHPGARFPDDVGLVFKR